MDTGALERAVAAAEAPAILVDSRVLRRVIKRHRHLPGLGLDVPHAGCYALDRAALLELVGPRDLGGRGADSLPADVVLLPRPEPDETRGQSELLRDLWRAAFHARVHLAIAKKVAAGELPEAAILERIHKLGHTEFEEVCLVLRQDDRLLARGDDGEGWAEFAATYLELARFEPARLSRMFPVLVEPARVETLLAEDVDADALLAASRPKDAPAPLVASIAPLPSIVPPAPPRRDAAARAPAIARAEKAATRGNHVRAALMHLAAAGSAAEGSTEAATDHEHARAALGALAASLSRALGGADALAGGPAAWTEAFVTLAARAVHGTLVERTVEARVLFDVQTACLEAERMPKKVELVAFLRSFGKKPVVRELPATREVKVARRLRAAAERAAHARVPPDALAHLTELFHALRARAEERLRETVGPAIEATLVGAGLAPKTAVERAALRTDVDQLLDGVVQRGFFGIGQLRDAISRHAIKMPNVTAGQLVRGDALLLADRRLADAIDGVYRGGEIYLRGLQTLSSIAFGTKLGRLFTLYLALPFGSAFVALEGAGHIVSPIAHLLGHKHHIHLLNPISFAATGIVIFALIHAPAFRHGLAAALRAIGGALHLVFVALPKRFLALPLVRRLLRSRGFRAVDRFVVRPAILTTALELGTPLRRLPAGAVVPTLGALFVAASLALNSPKGVLVEEAAMDFVARRLRWLRHRFFPGLYRLVSAFFARTLELIERGIYAVDEFLRFREGEHPVALVLKVVFGFVWFFAAYVLRIYTNLLIEPTFNPIKHFPVVTVSSKIVFAFHHVILMALRDGFATVLPVAVAHAIAGPTLFLLPGVFGFLVWELKENFRLYAQNRSRELAPVMIGHHGETMSALLRPGLHSGTIPKLFTKLRRASKEDDGRNVPAHQEALHEVGEAVERFVDREIVGLLATSPTWRWGALRVAHVALAASRVRISLALEGDAAPLVLHFEEQSGLLCAGVASPGFADRLSDQGRVALENALAGLYRLAGVDLSRQAVEHEIGGAAYDVSDDGLVVWPGGDYATHLVYDLTRPGEIHPRVRGRAPASPPPTLDAKRLLLRNHPLARDAWDAAWEKETPERLVDGPPLLPPRSQGEAFTGGAAGAGASAGEKRIG